MHHYGHKFYVIRMIFRIDFHGILKRCLNYSLLYQHILIILSSHHVYSSMRMYYLMCARIFGVSFLDTLATNDLYRDLHVYHM